MENGKYRVKLHFSTSPNTFQSSSLFIGIKKLLALIDMSRQTDERHRVIKLITKLEEDGALEDPGMA